MKCWQSVGILTFFILTSIKSFPLTGNVASSTRRNQYLFRAVDDDDDASTILESPSETTAYSRYYPRYQIDFRPLQESSRPFFFWSGGVRDATAVRTCRDGVSVLAYLWRQAANLVPGKKVVYTFPNAPETVRVAASRWVDLLEWTAQDCSYFQPLSVSYEEDGGVPVVTITAHHNRDDDDDDDDDNTATDNPLDHDIITKRTQAWVKRILVEQGICPFTKSVRTSGQGLADVGVPVGRIAYHTSNSNGPTDICTLQADVWEAIQAMLEAGPAGPSGVSSILLAAPAWDEHFETWAGPVFALLEAGVLAASLEERIGVVCFHPRYQIPDGQTWPGFGHMHSQPRLRKWVLDQDPECPFASQVAAGGAWQRRTPHATVNVLRSEQLAAAEGRRNSAQLYYDNIRKLVSAEGIGLSKLEQDLEKERRLE